MKLEKVVAALDFSATSVAAARWTAEYLAPDAELTLVHCLELPNPQSLLWEALPPSDELEPRIREASQKRLDQLISELSNGTRRGATRAEIVSGHPSEEVAKIATDQNVDLVVAGKHGGHHGVWHVLGSTAEQLVASCRRPVLLARNLPARRLQNVLVPVDRSELAVRALEWGTYLVGRHDARLVAHHVVTEWYYQNVREIDSEQKAREIQAEVTARARVWLEDLVTEHARNVRVTHHLGAGQPGFQTLAAIESFHADLVVVGTHGIQSLLGDPLARLSRFLILAAPCSVLVVPGDGKPTVE